MLNSEVFQILTGREFSKFMAENKIWGVYKNEYSIISILESKETR